MGIKFFKALFVVGFLLATTTVHAQNPNALFEITWLIPPNSTISMSASKTGEVELKELTGAYVKVFEQLQALAPRYKHKYQIVNVVRGRQRIKQGQHICSLLLMETQDRQEHMKFGPAVGYIMPSGLVLKSKKTASYQKYVSGQAIDLEALMNGSPFRVGAAAGRPFLEPVDSILESLKKGRVFRYYGETSSEGLLEMVAKDRIDGALVFFGEMKNSAALEKKTKDFDFFLLKQQSELVPLSIACGRNPWGEQVIEYLSPFLLQLQEIARHEISAQYKSILPTKIYDLYVNKLKKTPLSK